MCVCVCGVGGGGGGMVKFECRNSSNCGYAGLASCTVRSGYSECVFVELLSLQSVVQELFFNQTCQSMHKL